MPTFNTTRFRKQLSKNDLFFNAKTSSMRLLLEAMAADRSPDDVQQELDKIPHAKALKYESALQMLVDDNPMLCYTGLVSFLPVARARPMNVRVLPGSTHWRWGTSQTASGVAAWDSGMFEVTADVFFIVPTSVNRAWEIGFRQICTRKANLGRYTDRAVIQDRPVPNPPWGDSGQPSDTPWYTKGMHNGLLAWLPLPGGARTRTFGMNDSFNNRCHPYRSLTTGGNVGQGTLQEVDCEQNFTAYLCRVKASDPHTVTILKQVSYSITGGYRVGIGNVPFRQTSNVVIGQAFTPQPGASIPQTSAPRMNNSERWIVNNVAI